MRRPFLVGAIVIASALGGAVYGRSSAPAPTPIAPLTAERAGAPSLPMPMPFTASASVDEARLEATVEKAVRAELRRAQADHDAKSKADDEAAPASREQVAAATNANHVIHTATVAGRWTRSDASELGGLFASMHQEQQQQVVSTLVEAINSGRMKVEVDGAPF